MKAVAVTVLPEAVSEESTVYNLTKRSFAGKAFSDGGDQDLIEALRAAGAPAISLVAEQEGQIVGHVVLSPAFAKDGSPGWYALGPISVDPERQRQGIGGMLIRESMAPPRPDLAQATEPAEHCMLRILTDNAADTSVSFHPILSASGATP